MSAQALRTGRRALLGLAAERPGAALAAALLGVIVIAVALAPLIAPQNPFDLASFDVLDAELPPSWLQGSDKRFLLGTDAQGRDLFSAILYGTRISLLVGVLAVAIQAAIGVPLGLLAGYVGGRTDSLVTRAADIQLSLSTLMLAIIALALFRASCSSSASPSGPISRAPPGLRPRSRLRRTMFAPPARWGGAAPASCGATSCPTSSRP
jgi:peptide/nickel transport system permease protein